MRCNFRIAKSCRRLRGFGLGNKIRKNLRNVIVYGLGCSICGLSSAPAKIITSALDPILSRLLQKRHVFLSQLFLEQFEKRLLIFIPLKTILGMTDFEALQ